MNTSPVLSRRALFAAAAASTAAMVLPGRAVAQAGRPPVCVFSKHLQFLNYQELAAKAKELGVDGVDLTVRPGGHVEPAHVARDLAAAVAAVRAAGLEVHMISTALKSGTDADAPAIFEAALQQGIRHARVGGHKYAPNADIFPQIEAFTSDLRSLAALALQYGITLGYHNHSGEQYFGAPLWDLHRAITAVASANFGSNFDAGHATVEGPFGALAINARMMAPHVKMMAVKDFHFEGRRPKWVGLGKGCVDLPLIFGIMREAGFSGPISMHFEYEIPSHEALFEEIRRSVGLVREALAAAGYG